MTNVSSEIYFFFFFRVFFSQHQKKKEDDSGWNLVISLREDKTRSDGGSYVEVRLVQQNKSSGFKKIFSRWVEPQGAR